MARRGHPLGPKVVEGDRRSHKAAEVTLREAEKRLAEADSRERSIRAQYDRGRAGYSE